jgi:hypothetical protein
MYEFLESVTDCDVIGLNKHIDINSVDIEHGLFSTIVSYKAIPDVRRWGMKGFDIFINTIICEIPWYVYNDELTESQINKLIQAGGTNNSSEIEGTITISSADKDWSIKNELKIQTGGYLRIEKVEINLANKVIIVM